MGIVFAEMPSQTALTRHRSRDEENILEQIYKSKYVRIIIMMILIPYKIIRKCIPTLR